MAIKVDRINGQNYAENIVDHLLMFESGTWTNASGSGSATLDLSVSFVGDKSLKLENFTPASDYIVTNSVQNTLIPIPNDYQFSFYILKQKALEVREGDVLIYKNAVLLDTQPFSIGSVDTDADNTNVWVRFQSTQTYAFGKNDVITFQFKLKSATTVDLTTSIFIDGVMLNKAERGNKIVPYYNKPNGDLYNDYTGWGVYNDSTYTTGSPFSVTDGASAVALPNDAVSKIESQIPIDIDTFYDGTVITGRNGDGLNITFEFKARPTGAGANPRLTLAIDIGGAIGELYPRDFVLGKGNGVEHNIISSYNVYTLDTWETNGGTVMVSANNEDIEIYDIRYVLTRSHKAR